MERFSCRDRPLLGYSSPHRSIQNPSSSPKVPFRNSDVDFNDVFGGPPRRSSRNDMRHSFGNTLDTYASGGSEEALTSRSPWSALNEKPVFGEEVPIRRRYPSEDFFDDIFRGDEPSSFSPRKSGMDPFSSTPASRILSPVRPLPPKSEPFGPSSLPAHFSLPPKLAKGTDFPTLNASTSRSPHRNEDDASNGSFPSSPSAFTSRILNQSTQRQDGLRNDARLSYRRSLLSNEFSLSSEGSSKSTKSDKEDSGLTLKKDSSSSETHNNGNQFHFSIYKWAGKGVPLVMPLRGGNSSSSKERGNNVRSLSSKERGKNVSTVSELSASVLQSVEFPFFNDRLSPVNSSFHMECENQGYSSVINTVNEDRIDSFRFAQEAAPAKPDSKPLNSLQSIITEVPRGHAIRSGGKETNPFSDVSGSLHDVGLSMKPEKEMHVSMIEARKTELKPLCSLFYDNSDGQGKDEKAGLARRKEGKVEQITASYGNNDYVKNQEKKDGTKSILDVATSTSLQGSPVNSGDKPVRGKIKGKVKEFVKLFNQEAPLKPIINFGTRGHSSRWKDVDACKAEDEAGVCATKADEKENMTNLNKDKTLTDTYAMVDQTVKQPEKPQFVVNTIQKTYDTSSEEPIPASFEATLANVEEFHCEDLQGDCLVEELSHDPNKHQQTVDHHEEIQISDARIQQWSNGKETNIRSLLSTLQYVLWPESGWKPVALVDIVEGNAVKRAYQKALLCLHPDKLQQKGAASHQKYIAEKVFDILQEAWTHFNSLSSF